MSKNISRINEFKVNNLLVCNGQYIQNEVSRLIVRMKQYILRNSANIIGPTISATLGVHNNQTPSLVDLMIMLPIDREIDSCGEFYYVEEFKIENVLKARHNGNPATLNNTINEIKTFMECNNLIPTTVNYNVATKEAMCINDMDSMIIDIYIGVSDKT